MGRKGNWFSSVKKALSPDSKEKKDQVWIKVCSTFLNFLGCFLYLCHLLLQKSGKSKKKWFGKQKLQTSVSYSEADKLPPPAPVPLAEEIKLTDIENEISHDHDHVVEVVTAAKVEDPVPPVQIETVRVEAARIPRFAGKPNDEVAAIKIQTAFRGYLVCVESFI